MKVYIDGEIHDGERATISVDDHGLLYGDGIFEGIRAYGGRPFRLEAHLERMAYGARALGLSLPGGLEGLREAVERVVEAHGGDEIYLRLVVTRGRGPLGIDPTRCERPSLFCIADTIALFDEERRRAGLSMITSSVRRPAADVLDPRIKSLNYLNNVMAKAEARRQGVDEALMLNGRGQVAEATVANVFVVQGGQLKTPPTSDGCLDGVTRATVLELAAELGIDSRVETLGRIDLFSADEVFVTGTGAGILRVSSLDGQALGGRELGPITERLLAAYAEATRAAP
ncbi:MAG: aminotransferase class IV [Myxococcales bacterium]|nr:aminotransferase class IV [Myxococcales bacterium]